MSTSFYLTKKQKKQLKERRKKKKLAELGKLGDETQKEKDDTHQEETKKEEKVDIISVTSPSTKTTTTSTNKRKRDDYTIYIPEDIFHDTKAAKKFRKDARRNAKRDGLDESKLIFRNESERKTRKFPKIKELVEQQQEQEPTIQSVEPTVDTSKYVALDCEMVGIGTDGKRSVLARASLVDWDGNCLFDRYVKVPVQVTDFRTKYSGIRPVHLKQQNHPLSPTACRNAIAELIKDKILVGHALHNDLEVLLLQHYDIRDTAKYRPFQRMSYGGKYRPRKLRDLVEEHLGKTIQKGAHDSVQDAAATMELFKTVHREWEQEIALQLQKKHRKRNK